jgi:beta-lactamase superfamily II metal-dependent hydrolase
MTIVMKLKNLFMSMLMACSIALGGCTSQTSVSSSSSEDTLMTIRIYDVGKADAMVIKTVKGNVLIDTGLEENADALVSSLQEDGVDSLYAIIVTHFDKDHAGGVATVLKTYTPEHVYTTYTSDDGVNLSSALADAGLTAEVVSGDTSFTLGEATFTINGTTQVYDSNTDNNSSLITSITCGTQTYLFMGDAQKDRINEYMTTHDGTVNFLKMPYHGHYMNVIKSMLETLQPSDAVMCCSEDNPASSEREETAALLKKDNINAYYTYNGDVTVSCTESGYTIYQ